MRDQAAGLRRLFARRAARPLGVGGADTTPVAFELGLAMAELGTRVLVVDRTRGDIAARLGCRARYELSHVLRGALRLELVCVVPTGDRRQGRRLLRLLHLEHLEGQAD